VDKIRAFYRIVIPSRRDIFTRNSYPKRRVPGGYQARKKTDPERRSNGAGLTRSVKNP